MLTVLLLIKIITMIKNNNSDNDNNIRSWTKYDIIFEQLVLFCS